MATASVSLSMLIILRDTLYIRAETWDNLLLNFLDKTKLEGEKCSNTEMEVLWTCRNSGCFCEYWYHLKNTGLAGALGW